MIIYNVTVLVNWDIHADWLQWMQKEHIQDVMRTACFSGYRLARILELEDPEGPTYTCQYFAESKADYNRYITLYSDALRKSGLEKWKNGFIAFRSLMEVVQ